LAVAIGQVPAGAARHSDQTLKFSAMASKLNAFETRDTPQAATKAVT